MIHLVDLQGVCVCVWGGGGGGGGEGEGTAFVTSYLFSCTPNPS